ncbi:ATP-binding protein [Streptacidiphilus fuscans]|uniref:AAA family ATPase n=1 Tax=Streptacidiphilus fuscans TaxID=2789292 RepID=A0A931B1J6_9ACTN|nr:LuxR family transcriptional regulator [Streptacidiphilus fuscans]MBF9068694.1 AAA family ATPase [Streptacidiphilus fuscans]
MLYGRGAEQAAIDELLRAAQGRTSGALVLRGEPGIGKTALLEYARGAAEGFTVLRTAGVEAESELPFAALQLLLAPALGGLEALPAPQRSALERALGLAEPAADASTPGSRLLVGLGVLGLLAELAEAGPVLCLVDDVQWCDAASADALFFAARRLAAEGVVLLLAAREGEAQSPDGTSGVAPGLAELRLSGLDDAAAAQLLQHSAPETDSLTRRQLLELAHGNPLALHELPAAERSGSEPLPLAGRLQLAYHGQLSRLPAAAQTMLLVAAAEETGELPTVLAAAERLGAHVEDLQAAEESALVRVEPGETGGRLAFRHPLLRAAALSRAPLAQRLAVHAALAEALADHGTPVRRAWHLAQAATGPDEPVAAELERAAELAARRGGHAGAASAWERASQLSPDPAEATRRLVQAAESATEAGEIERAEALAGRARARRPEEPVLLAHLMFIEGLAQFWRGAHEPAHQLLLDTAELVAASHPGPAARVLLQAYDVARCLDAEAMRTTEHHLAALPLPDDDPLAPTVAYLLDAVASDAPAPASPMPDVPTPDTAADEVKDGRSLPATLARARSAGAIVPIDLIQACAAALTVGQDADALAVTEQVVAEARAAGVLAALPPLLITLAESELFHGRADQAQAHAEEALALATDIRQVQWVAPAHSLLAYLAAQRGDEAACRAALHAASAEARGGASAQVGVPWQQWAEGLLDLGQGRAEEALASLGALVRGPDRGHVSALRAVPDALEAAVRLREGEALAEPLSRFERWAERSRQPWARALVLRCHALLAPEEFAEQLFLDALSLHGGSGRPWEEARTALLYGEWLRRARRKSEARTPLRAAARAFDALGATPWADRARTELDASGAASAEPRTVGPLSGLTPQETQIVRLAAQGLSNRDIAAQLFLSSRTVGYHLYKAYPKLGVASRGELAALV